MYFEFLLLCFSICSRLVAVVDSCNLIWIIQRQCITNVDRDSVREIYFLQILVFFLLIEVLLTRLTVSCDNWNELTCWISTAIRQPLSCYRAVPGDPGLTIQAVSYAADTRSAWKRLCTPGYPAARGCLNFKPVQVASSRENGQAGAVVVTDARAGRTAPRRRAPLARTHARQTRLQPGYIEISSLLYCDNCTLIGTGLEMTRPAYRLHIVSRIH